MRGGTMFYYFNYYVDQARLLEFLQRLGLPQATAAQPDGGHYADERARADSQRRSHRTSRRSDSACSTSPARRSPSSASSCPTSLAMRFGKRAVALVGFSLDDDLPRRRSSCCPPTPSGRRTGSSSCARCAYAPTIPLIWAMFADVADYAEWKTGRRTTGVVFATILFGLKTGLSLGGAIAGWLLSGYGYRAERDADRARADGHSAHGERVPGDLPRASSSAVSCSIESRARSTMQMATELEAAPPIVRRRARRREQSFGAEGSLAYRQMSAVA